MISGLVLSHFRSHRRAELDFDGRPVAVFGPNGAGKTNILEALSLLSPGRGLRRAAPEDLARKPESIGWKVSAGLQGLHGAHDLVTASEPGAARSVAIDGKPATQTALGRLLRILWLVPSMDRLWTEAAEGRRRFLDRATLSFEPSHAETVLAYDKAMRERNRLLRDDVRDDRWYDALESQMAAAGAVIQQNRALALSLLARAQAQAETAFPAAVLTIVPPEGGAAEGEAALTEALAAGRRRDLAAGRTLTGPHRDDLDAVYAAKGVAAAQCSTGEQKALLVSLILSNARALREMLGEPPVLLLDEIAAHLDATRRMALYDEIIALGAQAFMTGTGPELFVGLRGGAQFLSVGDGPDGSVVTPVSPPDGA